MTKAKEAQELFYRDDNFDREDADIHEPILASGDHKAAQTVSEIVMKRLGFSDAQIKRHFQGRHRSNGETPND